MRINRIDVFGPVASLLHAKDYSEALYPANDPPFGLAAGIATTSLKRFLNHLDALERRVGGRKA